VTGASSGLGRRLALDLASAGATVTGIARREDRLKALGVGYRVCDVGDVPAEGCWRCSRRCEPAGTASSRTCPRMTPAPPGRVPVTTAPRSRRCRPRYDACGDGVRLHVTYPAWVPTEMGLRAVNSGGLAMPPRAARRSEEQVASLVLRRLGGPRVEINCAALPLVAPLFRTVAPRSYHRMRAKH